MAYLELSELRRLHIELSNHCNAACPQCDRNIYGAGVNPRLKLSHLSLKDIQKFFPQLICEQVDDILLSGVHGDPMMAPEAFDIVEYFVLSGLKSVEIHTNGGMNSTTWWAKLGSILRSSDQVTFGIDGLEDTHSLYRRGTSWKLVTEHMKAFIQAGGKARWSFLVFRHNEHQVEQARELAKEWGCHSFRVRKTGRFQAMGLRHGSAPTPVLKRNPGLTVDQRFIDEVYGLVPPTYSEKTDFAALLANHGFETILEEAGQEELKNESTTEGHLNEVVAAHGSAEKYWDETSILCPEKEDEQQLYVDANGLLWPCCYIGGDTKSWHPGHRFRVDLEEKLLSKYGPDFNSLHLRTLPEILNHPWFREELEKSWSSSLHDKETPRLKRCGRTCGAKYSPNKFQNTQIRFK